MKYLTSGGFITKPPSHGFRLHKFQRLVISEEDVHVHMVWVSLVYLSSMDANTFMCTIHITW